MGKVFGILLMVIALWAALELYTGGGENAMGGDSFVTSAPQKAKRSVQRSIDKSAERYQKLLD